MLLEKAWAKINRSYDNVDGGFTRETLHDFSCAPVKQWFTEDLKTSEERNLVWTKLEHGESKNFVMTAGS